MAILVKWKTIPRNKIELKKKKKKSPNKYTTVPKNQRTKELMYRIKKCIEQNKIKNL